MQTYVYSVLAMQRVCVVHRGTASVDALAMTL